MTQPMIRANSTNAMNPPSSGQNMGENILRVQRDLLARRRECPGDLQPALLAEDEAQLAGGPQAVRVGRAKGGAWTCLRHGTEKVGSEEAVLAAHLR
jgi:hypothetical protein